MTTALWGLLCHPKMSIDITTRKDQSTGGSEVVPKGNWRKQEWNGTIIN
jgi:hypothetical protein